MRLNSFQIESLGKKILNFLEQKQAVTFAHGKQAALTKAIDILNDDYSAEKNLEDQVNRAIDDLEKQETDGFNRHQMFRMMKKKMAEEQGLIL